LNHLLSDAFVDVVADLMAKDPAQRVPSALAVIERLAPWASEFQNQRQASAPGNPISPPSTEKAVPASAMAITPLEPLNPPVPSLPPEDQRFALPIVPPPVIAQPVTGWDWGGSSGGDSPPLTTEALLRDTLPDLPAGLEGTSDSEVSMSLIVEPPRRIPVELLVALVLAPIVLAGIGLVVAWLLNIAF
jgi:hypothetical protein